MVPQYAVKIVAGYLEGVREGGVVGDIAAAVERCSAEACAGVYRGAKAEKRRQQLVACIEWNAINRKEYPIIDMCREYKLNVSPSTFKRLKYQYIGEVAKAIGIWREKSR